MAERLLHSLSRKGWGNTSGLHERQIAHDNPRSNLVEAFIELLAGNAVLVQCAIERRDEDFLSGQLEEKAGDNLLHLLIHDFSFLAPPLSATPQGFPLVKTGGATSLYAGDLQ